MATRNPVVANNGVFQEMTPGDTLLGAVQFGVDSNNNPNSVKGYSGETIPLTTTRAVEARGDSLTFGYSFTAGQLDPTKTYGQLFANTYALGATYANYGHSGSLTIAQFSNMVSNVESPSQLNNLMTLWLAGYNDMAQGTTAAQLEGFRGHFFACLLIMAGKLSGFRQYYNGGGGGTFLGAPAGTLSQTFSAGIGNYGATNYWRGLKSTTQGETLTATVTGDVVYIMYDRNTANTGGLFKVAIDGIELATNISCDGTGMTATGDNVAILRIPTTAGKHTVVCTVTSITGTTNQVIIESVSGNANLWRNAAVIVGLCPTRNAAGYAALAAAYPTAMIGDAAVALYQNIQREVIALLFADGFNVKSANLAGYLDATVAANTQTDNIHFTTAGHALMLQAFSDAYTLPVRSTMPAPSISTRFNAGPPSNVLALAGNGQASVQWNGNHSGAPLSWTITSSPGNLTTTIPAINVMQGSATITGLTNGTAYTFTVVANNSFGASRASAASNSVTPNATIAALPVTRGLAFWWEAGRVVSPPANGVALTSLVDISGNGYNAAVTSGQTAALWVTSWSNAKPALAFNAAGSFNTYDTLASGLLSGMRSGNETIYVVYDCTANPSLNSSQLEGRVISVEGPVPGLLGVDIGTTGGGFAISVGGNSGQAGGKALDNSFRYQATQISNTDIAVPTTPIRAVAIRGSDTLYNPGTFRVNGAAPAQTLPVTNTLSPAPNLGLCFAVGAMYAGGFNKYFTGRVAAIIIFAASHTPTEVASMETYLSGLF